MRVFVGLKIAPAIAGQLAQFATALERPFVRPVAPTDIHLTLVPPWNERSISDVIAKLDRVAAGFSAFPLLFQPVGYGPQPARPRLLWAECAPTDEISALRAVSLKPSNKPTSGRLYRT
jgi:2'-5' RNA ligase